MSVSPTWCVLVCTTGPSWIVRCPETPSLSSMLSVPGHGKALPRALPARIPRDQDWPRRDFITAGPQTLPSSCLCLHGARLGPLKTCASFGEELGKGGRGGCEGVYIYVIIIIVVEAHNTGRPSLASFRMLQRLRSAPEVTQHGAGRKLLRTPRPLWQRLCLFLSSDTCGYSYG